LIYRSIHPSIHPSIIYLSSLSPFLLDSSKRKNLFHLWCVLA
jgi:hypothetical protein